MTTYKRRSFVLAVAGTAGAALAGCSSDQDDGSEEMTDGMDGTESMNTEAMETESMGTESMDGNETMGTESMESGSMSAESEGGNDDGAAARSSTDVHLRDAAPAPDSDG